MKVRRLRAAVPSGGGMGVRGRELEVSLLGSSAFAGWHRGAIEGLSAGK